MDSVTQIALGACVGVAVLGRKIGPRRAALTGAVMGTLPDLDVYLAPDDPIESFVQHRGWSHSLIVHAAATPILGETVRRVFKPLNAHRTLAYAAVFLCLWTHALLDAVTIYGTRLFWPLWSEPISLGAIFIIDPLYTLPLLVAMIWALSIRNWTPLYRKALTASLGLSVAYLGWTVIAQQWVSNKAMALLESHNVRPDQLIATPTPFNSIYWRAIGIDGDRSFNLYMPVFGGPDTATFYAYDRNLSLVSCETDDPRVASVADFSNGYYRILVNDGEVSVADLRMGLTPNYAFRFTLGRLDGEKLAPLPTLRLEGRGDVATDLGWLLRNLRGQTTIRPAEAAARMDLRRYAAAAAPVTSARC